MPFTKKVLNTLLAAGLATALGAASSSAMAVVFNDFTVSTSPYDPSPNTFTADKITGNYQEVITFTGAGTFQVSLLWQAGQFVAADGTDPVNAGGAENSGLGAEYGVYALYQGSGTFTTSGGVTTFVTDAGTGSLAVFIDDDLDTTFTAPLTGAGAFTTGLDSDDVLIATGVPLGGEGTLDPSLSTCDPGINCGSFGTSTSFILEVPDGSNFFFDPNPFYNISFQSGQLNNFDVAGTQVINGSMDVVFASVPEPASVALVGLGLLGVGLSRRRRA